MCIIGLVYCVVYFVYLGGLLYYMLAYHRCNLCSEYLCYVMPGCFALSCPKNFRAQSDLVLFCAPDNKSLKLETLEHDITVCFEIAHKPNTWHWITCHAVSSKLFYYLFFSQKGKKNITKSLCMMRKGITE